MIANHQRLLVVSLRRALLQGAFVSLFVAASPAAFAEGADLHGRSPERHWVREARSAQVWGAIIPALVLAATVVLGPRALLGLLVYPLQFIRLTWKGTGPLSTRMLKAFFLLLGKFPEAAGVLNFHARRLVGQRARLIEYK